MTPLARTIVRLQSDPRVLNPGLCRFMVYTQAGLQLDLQATVH